MRGKRSQGAAHLFNEQRRREKQRLKKLRKEQRKQQRRVAPLYPAR